MVRPTLGDERRRGKFRLGLGGVFFQLIGNARRCGGFGAELKLAGDIPMIDADRLAHRERNEGIFLRLIEAGETGDIDPLLLIGLFGFRHVLSGKPQTTPPPDSSDSFRCNPVPNEPKYRSWVSIFHRRVAEVAKERRALHVGR